MKTQVFKNSEPVKSSDSMMVFAMIIFWGLLLFAVDNVYVLLKKETSNSLAKHENGLQFRKMNKSENAVGNENVSTKNQGIEIEFSMAKMQEYLIPETEPELEASIANSIIFPNDERVKLNVAENNLCTDDLLKDLQFQASKKTNEAVELFALEMKAKGYLTIETELPLQLEDWMFNEKCWCPEMREPMAFKEEK